MIFEVFFQLKLLIFLFMKRYIGLIIISMRLCVKKNSFNNLKFFISVILVVYGKEFDFDVVVIRVFCSFFQYVYGGLYFKCYIIKSVIIYKKNVVEYIYVFNKRLLSDQYL